MADYIKVKVGTYKVEEKTTYTTHYECAAWHQDVEVEPGEYPVYVYLRHYGEHAHSLYVDATGTVSSACFRSQWAGNPFGDDRGGKEALGKVAKASISIPSYAINDYIERGKLTLDMSCFTRVDHVGKDGTKHVFYRENPGGMRQARV